jgi:hypothetical protein
VVVEESDGKYKWIDPEEEWFGIYPFEKRYVRHC